MHCSHLQTSRFDNNLPLHFSHSMSAEKSSMFLVLTRFLLGILAVCTIVQGPSLLNSILLRFHVDQQAFPFFISGNLIYLKSGYIHNFTSTGIRSAEYSSSSWQIWDFACLWQGDWLLDAGAGDLWELRRRKYVFSSRILNSTTLRFAFFTYLIIYFCGQFHETYYNL